MAQISERKDSSCQLTSRQCGARYEHQARRYLESQGLRFVAANIVFRGGELDLIMRQRQTWIFVEVRYRHSAQYGDALASVTFAKRRRLLQTAQLWLARQNKSFDTVDCRFDVVAFTGGKIAWLVNAFTTDN